MAQFKDKKDYKQLWHSPLTLLILFCILIIFAYNMIGLIQKEGETRRKKIVELENIENLRKRQSNLDTNIAKLNTDEGVEELIREKYQVAKAGESVIRILLQYRCPKLNPRKAFGSL